MKFEPRPYQHAGILDAIEFLRNAAPGDKRLYSAPTGCGKSIVEAMVQDAMGRDKCSIVTPRIEIIDGMLDKLEAPPESDGTEYNIWTPITLRNRLAAGVIRHPEYVIFDETHHHNANSWQQLDLLTGLAPAVGYTASPYRGTPKSTAEFLEHWGEPVPLITYPEAVAAGYISMPEMSILPLVDDDLVDVSGGDFQVTSLEAATVDRLGDLAEHSRQWYADSKWDMATIYAVPSGALATKLQTELGRRGLPSAIVSCHYPRNQRPEVFRATEERILALIHVDVVSEGVDLKLRRYIDAAPTLSPVKWVQRLGRIMRPWEHTPQYICTNRNILRHAYILEGAVPPKAVAETEAKFGVSKRGQSRVLGMEAIGRFKPATLKCKDGCSVYIYNLNVLANNVVVEYCCLAHPAKEPIWAVKVNTIKDGVKSYGNWVKCEQPTDLRGFGSAPGKEPSPKQQQWWNKSAEWKGLVRDQPLTRKSFVALPVLCDLGEKL